MDEIWEKAIKTALHGETDSNSVTNLTLDGAVKCFQVRFPPPSLLEKFCNLEHLSIANAGVSSLENFPKLPKLEKLVLSDNRIAGGLEYLVKAGLNSLRDLDLSNNKIQFIRDLVPLAGLKVVSLDLYECPVTKVENYRGEVFELVKSVKYLDKMDENENERLESDDEEDDDDDDDDEEEEEEEDDTGLSNGVHVVDVDESEDEESDADEEESEMVKGVNEEELDEEDDEVEEIDEEDEEVIEVHEIEDSDDDGSDDSDDDDEEEVDDEEDVELVSTGRMTSTEGEVDGHEQGEDENGESGEEEELNSDDDIEDEDGTEFLVQPAGQHEEEEDVAGSGSDAVEEDVDSAEEEEVDDEDVLKAESQSEPSSSSQSKRKREDDSVEEDDNSSDEEAVENGHLQAHLSTSAQLKKKRNGVVGDAKD